MNSPRPSFAKFQVQDLNAAIAQNSNYDALPLTLSASEWAPLIGSSFVTSKPEEIQGVEFCAPCA